MRKDAPLKVIMDENTVKLLKFLKDELKDHNDTGIKISFADISKKVKISRHLVIEHIKMLKEFGYLDVKIQKHVNQPRIINIIKIPPNLNL